MTIENMTYNFRIKLANDEELALIWKFAHRRGIKADYAKEFHTVLLFGLSAIDKMMLDKIIG